MAHLQYMPGDPRLVDQLVYELKSKGIFDQFRKDCIADVDTRPAYQNLRQRVENSVSSFLSRQTWQPDLNKNQLREKLRKHILDGNYLEQGVERIVDQVVNPKVASVFIPKVEDLVYNYLGITKKKSPAPETSNGKIEDLLPNDLEAVSPGSVKSNEDKNESMELGGQEESKMEVDEDKSKSDTIDNSVPTEDNAEKTSQIQLPSDGGTDEKIEIPLPDEEIKPENIPEPKKMEVEKIELPREPIVSTDIPLPDDAPKEEKDDFFKPINSDDDDSSSDSSLRRNMSPLTPIRNYNNENSCDAQQAFENDTVDDKSEDKKEPNSFRFAIEAKSPEKSPDAVKPEKKEAENSLAYQFNSQVNINTPQYEDSSNSNILHIDYESDANSKVNLENKGADNDQSSKDSRKEQKPDERRSSHKSSHRSRDSHKHSSSKDKRSDTKQTSSRDSSRQDKSKSSKDETKSKSSDKERSRDRGDRKDSRDSSRQRSSSHKSSHKDSKSHRSSSSSQKHASKSDDKKSTSSQKDKEKSSDKTEKSKDSKSSTQKYNKDRKSSSSKSDKTKSKHDDKDKKNKKETDDHYSVSGRGNPNRRSTDRDSNDGSSSSKGSNNQSSSKSTNGKKESKSSSKSETTSTSGESTSPSDKENVVHHGTSAKDLLLHKPIVRIESHLETPVASPPRLPFVPDVTIRKPKFAANLEEAKRLMKMRKFLDEEQKRMNQEAALLLEFQANVRPSMSQVYSSIPGPELEFACITNSRHAQNLIQNDDMGNVQEAHYTNNQLLTVLNDECEEERSDREYRATTSTEPVAIEVNDGRHAPELPQNIQNLIYSVDKSQDGIANNLGTTAEKTSSNSEGKRHGRVRNEIETKTHINGEAKLRYFGKNEQCDAEMERDRFTSFFIEYKEKSTNNKLYLINCDSYQENVIRDVSKGFGQFVITNYIKNGHLKLPTTSVIKNVNISREISLPMDTDYETVDSESPKSRTFSPGKSECSFELTSDYDAKLTEMVSKASRQEIMEIILGSALDSSPSRMPRIDYFTDSNIDAYESNMKRKMADETTVNNNIQVLAPNKIRKLSTDQITSTTQEIEEMSTNKTNCTRSKYLGKARRVGLPRPRKTMLPNSPSSDKSVENYEQNTLTQSPNGKIKRTKVQRYDTSDLYKPKLHFLSRRNHIT